MAHAAERPNIIYIFTDQHTANAMSCAGNPDLHTPNLDRLAAAGIMFQNAYCTAPLSGPSRGAMVYRMLSRHNRTVGQRCSATRIAPARTWAHW